MDMDHVAEYLQTFQPPTTTHPSVYIGFGKLALAVDTTLSQFYRRLDLTLLFDLMDSAPGVSFTSTSIPKQAMAAALNEIILKHRPELNTFLNITALQVKKFS